jgi:hypothetical protein
MADVNEQALNIMVSIEDANMFKFFGELTDKSIETTAKINKVFVSDFVKATSQANALLDPLLATMSDLGNQLNLDPAGTAEFYEAIVAINDTMEVMSFPEAKIAEQVEKAVGIFSSLNIPISNLSKDIELNQSETAEYFKYVSDSVGIQLDHLSEFGDTINVIFKTMETDAVRYSKIHTQMCAEASSETDRFKSSIVGLSEVYEKLGINAYEPLEMLQSSISDASNMFTDLSAAALEAISTNTLEKLNLTGNKKEIEGITKAIDTKNKGHKEELELVKDESTEITGIAKKWLDVISKQAQSLVTLKGHIAIWSAIADKVI